MKKDFFNYYQLSDSDFKKIWKDAIFVFDTNILLNLYRYSTDARKDWIDTMKSISTKNRLFLPYQVGLEFNRNRFAVIEEVSAFYPSYEKMFKDTLNSFENNFKQSKRIGDTETLLKDISKIFDKTLSKLKKESPDFIEKDHISDELDQIFNKKIGSELTKEKEDQLLGEAKDRYQKKIPPGYADKNKENGNEFGDFFIWSELIGHSIEQKKPIIFVTDDVKEDWWLLNKSKNILLPHSGLRKEFYVKTKQLYYQYTATNFIKHAKTSLHAKVDDSTIKETVDVSKGQLEKRDLDRSIKLAALQQIIETSKKVEMENLKTFLEESQKTKNVLNDSALSSIIGQTSLSNWKSLESIRNLGIDQSVLDTFSKNMYLENKNIQEILKAASIPSSIFQKLPNSPKSQDDDKDEK